MDDFDNDKYVCEGEKHYGTVNRLKLNFVYVE